MGMGKLSVLFRLWTEGRARRIGRFHPRDETAAFGVVLTYGSDPVQQGCITNPIPQFFKKPLPLSCHFFVVSSHSKLCFCGSVCARMLLHGIARLTRDERENSVDGEKHHELQAKQIICGSNESYLSGKNCRCKPSFDVNHDISGEIMLWINSMTFNAVLKSPAFFSVLKIPGFPNSAAQKPQVLKSAGKDGVMNFQATVWESHWHRLSWLWVSVKTYITIGRWPSISTSSKTTLWSCSSLLLNTRFSHGLVTWFALAVNIIKHR